MGTVRADFYGPELVRQHGGDVLAGPGRAVGWHSGGVFIGDGVGVAAYFAPYFCLVAGGFMAQGLAALCVGRALRGDSLLRRALDTAANLAAVGFGNWRRGLSEPGFVVGRRAKTN